MPSKHRALSNICTLALRSITPITLFLFSHKTSVIPNRVCLTPRSKSLKCSAHLTFISKMPMTVVTINMAQFLTRHCPHQHGLSGMQLTRLQGMQLAMMGSLQCQVCGGVIRHNLLSLEEDLGTHRHQRDLGGRILAAYRDLGGRMSICRNMASRMSTDLGGRKPAARRDSTMWATHRGRTLMDTQMYSSLIDTLIDRGLGGVDIYGDREQGLLMRW